MKYMKETDELEKRETKTIERVRPLMKFSDIELLNHRFFNFN